MNLVDRTEKSIGEKSISPIELENLPAGINLAGRTADTL
jgi:hypothetical protein